MNTRRRPVTPSPNIFVINAKICRLVAQHPCLYDRSDSAYMRKSIVKNAWRDISKEMRNSVKSCKERWRNIRTSYARSIKVHHGANTYYLNSELQFLQNHITPGVPVPLRGRRSRALAQQMQDQEELEENKTTVEAILDMKQSPSSRDTEHAQSHDSDALDDADTESEEESEDEKESRQGRAQKRLRLSKDSKGDSKAAGSTMDSDDAFLQGLRPEIKQMNFRQKLYFKRRVYELLGEIFDAGESASSCLPPTLQSVQHQHLPDTVNSPPNPLHHLGLTLQLPKLMAKPSS
ncbi:hypothetical protein KR009_001220 [Drosophila setifemur]|nr:hypothetical protein KR009_001220 [Drosophila setifemur]